MNRPLYLRMQIAHFRSHIIPLRNVLLFKCLHMNDSTPKSGITWSEMGTTNNEGKEVYLDDNSKNLILNEKNRI